MRAFIGSITCLFMMCTSFTGCGDADIAWVIFGTEQEEMTEIAETSSLEGVVDHGLTTIEVTEENLHYYSEYGITATGLVIIESKNTSELLVGDMILMINGQKIGCANDIEPILSGCRVGDIVTVTVIREENEVSVPLRLTEKVPNQVSFD